MVDFFPEQDDKTFTFAMKLRYESLKNRTLEEFVTGTVNKKIGRVLIKRYGLKPEMRVEEAGQQKVLELMGTGRNFSIHISGVNPMENAQICAGGIDFSQIDDQMESALVPGLYFAGEIVDVDGKCGGYNLQWAWSSGYVAGRSAAGYSAEEMRKDLEPEVGDKG